MNRRFAWIWGLATVAIATIVGFVAYHAGQTAQIVTTTGGDGRVIYPGSSCSASSSGAHGAADPAAATGISTRMSTEHRACPHRRRLDRLTRRLRSDGIPTTQDPIPLAKFPSPVYGGGSGWGAGHMGGR